MQDKKRTAKMNIPMDMWAQDDGGTPPQVGDSVCVYGKVQGMTNANILVSVEKVEPDMNPENDENETDNSEQAPPEMGAGSMG